MSFLLRLFTGLKGLWGYAATALGAIAAVAGIYLAGRKSGKDAVKSKQARKSLKAARKANEIRDKNAGLGKDKVIRKLKKYERQ